VPQLKFKRNQYLLIPWFLVQIPFRIWRSSNGKVCSLPQTTSPGIFFQNVGGLDSSVWTESILEQILVLILILNSLWAHWLASLLFLPLAWACCSSAIAACCRCHVPSIAAAVPLPASGLARTKHSSDEPPVRSHRGCLHTPPPSLLPLPHAHVEALEWAMRTSKDDPPSLSPTTAQALSASFYENLSSMPTCRYTASPTPPSKMGAGTLLLALFLLLPLWDSTSSQHFHYSPSRWTVKVPPPVSFPCLFFLSKKALRLATWLDRFSMFSVVGLPPLYAAVHHWHRAIMDSSIRPPCASTSMPSSSLEIPRSSQARVPPHRLLRAHAIQSFLSPPPLAVGHLGWVLVYGHHLSMFSMTSSLGCDKPHPHRRAEAPSGESAAARRGAPVGCWPGSFGCWARPNCEALGHKPARDCSSV
jgi:hypothetical protein